MANQQMWPTGGCPNFPYHIDLNASLHDVPIRQASSNSDAYAVIGHLGPNSEMTIVTFEDPNVKLKPDTTTCFELTRAGDFVYRLVPEVYDEVTGEVLDVATTVQMVAEGHDGVFINCLYRGSIERGEAALPALTDAFPVSSCMFNRIRVYITSAAHHPFAHHIKTRLRCTYGIIQSISSRVTMGLDRPILWHSPDGRKITIEHGGANRLL